MSSACTSIHIWNVCPHDVLPHVLCTALRVALATPHVVFSKLSLVPVVVNAASSLGQAYRPGFSRGEFVCLCQCAKRDGRYRAWRVALLTKGNFKRFVGDNDSDDDDNHAPCGDYYMLGVLQTSLVVVVFVSLELVERVYIIIQ